MAEVPLLMLWARLLSAANCAAARFSPFFGAAHRSCNEIRAQRAAIAADRIHESEPHRWMLDYAKTGGYPSDTRARTGLQAHQILWQFLEKGEDLAAAQLAADNNLAHSIKSGTSATS